MTFRKLLPPSMALGLMALGVFLLVGEGNSQESSSAPAPEATRTSSCLGDPQSLEELRLKQLELEQLRTQLKSKEQELDARQTALETEIKRLDTLKAEISQIGQKQKNQHEEKVSKLIETFETMSPKAVAQLLAGLEESLAVLAMERMDTTKLAKVMNLLEVQKSTRLSELLAGVTRSDRSTNLLRRGGENHGNQPNIEFRDANEVGRGAGERAPAGGTKKL
jgi:flagellar motility protein MotE (MotC chaperone)